MTVSSSDELEDKKQVSHFKLASVELRQEYGASSTDGDAARYDCLPTCAIHR